MQECDVAIVGAGPAGMAAAIALAGRNLSIVVLDEQKRPGGQIYRDIGTRVDQSDPLVNILGVDYWHGRQLVDRFLALSIDYHCSASVWSIDDDGCITYSMPPTRPDNNNDGNRRTHDRVTHQLSARHIILATGAIERPVPVPGWTLPGVMGVGAAQSLIKSSALVPEAAVLVGNGPLLYLTAIQMLRAGVKPAAIIETPVDYRAAATSFLSVVSNVALMLKGLRWLAQLRVSGLVFYRSATALSIEDTDSGKRIKFSIGSKTHQVDAAMILLHQGVVPNVQLTRSLRLEHQWDTQQRCFTPKLDDTGLSTNPMVSVVGDGATILGAAAAELTGELTALRVLEKLDPGSSQKSTFQKTAKSGLKRRSVQLKKQVARERRFRSLLNTLYQPSQELQNPPDDTVVCRCENVSALTLRTSAVNGCSGANQAKTATRVGMGPCQGRYCGLTVTEMLSRSSGLLPEQVGYFRIRSPVKPVTLAELASLTERSGVDRDR